MPLRAAGRQDAARDHLLPGLRQRGLGGPLMSDVHAINDEAAAARSTGTVPTVRVGQVLWKVPIRWWEPEDYAPERCVVLAESDGKPQWDAERPTMFDLYVHSDLYRHPVFINGADCFDTEAEAAAEMARRTEVREAADRAWAERLVDEIRANPERNWLEMFLQRIEEDER